MKLNILQQGNESAFSQLVSWITINYEDESIKTLREAITYAQNHSTDIVFVECIDERVNGDLALELVGIVECIDVPGADLEFSRGNVDDLRRIVRKSLDKRRRVIIFTSYHYSADGADYLQCAKWKNRTTDARACALKLRDALQPCFHSSQVRVILTGIDTSRGGGLTFAGSGYRLGPKGVDGSGKRLTLSQLLNYKHLLASSDKDLEQWLFDTIRNRLYPDMCLEMATDLAFAMRRNVRRMERIGRRQQDHEGWGIIAGPRKITSLALQQDNQLLTVSLENAVSSAEILVKVLRKAWANGEGTAAARGARLPLPFLLCHPVTAVKPPANHDKPHPSHWSHALAALEARKLCRDLEEEILRSHPDLEGQGFLKIGALLVPNYDGLVPSEIEDDELTIMALDYTSALDKPFVKEGNQDSREQVDIILAGAEAAMKRIRKKDRELDHEPVPLSS